jgi:hypothetical protein
MKRFLSFVILLCHINASMFLPQVAEEDVYDTHGRQVDDVNTVIEYVQVALGYDHHADDEDDDNGQNFHLVKSFEYKFQQAVAITLTRNFCALKPTVFVQSNATSFPTTISDVSTPPPEYLTA